MEDGKTVKPAKISIRETWESLEVAVDQGIAHSIGVSKFQAQSLYDMFTYNKNSMFALQIEHHPYLTQPGLINMAQAHGIAVTAYSSFGPNHFWSYRQTSGSVLRMQHCYLMRSRFR
jgi:D-xylose reductase